MMRRAVLRVGDGRGFVVEHRNFVNIVERIIVTAAHCLPRLPPPHPARYLDEETYKRLLGALGGKRTVWARCLFVDPMADIAALGAPDDQALSDEADAYDDLVAGMTALTVADAPAMDFRRLTYKDPDQVINQPVAGKGRARVLSLKGRWLAGQVERRSAWLAFEPQKHFVGGMSGSPIINDAGAAIGVVSVDHMSPVIMDTLAPWLLRSIRFHTPVKTVE